MAWLARHALKFGLMLIVLGVLLGLAIWVQAKVDPERVGPLAGTAWGVGTALRVLALFYLLDHWFPNRITTSLGDAVADLVHYEELLSQDPEPEEKAVLESASNDAGARIDNLDRASKLKPQLWVMALSFEAVLQLAYFTVL